MKLIRFYYLVIFIFVSLPAHAELQIEITGAGEHQIPIVIVPFAGENKLPQSISSIIMADLARSGIVKIVTSSDKSLIRPQNDVYNSWSGVDAFSINPTLKSPHEPHDVVFSLWAGIDALLVGTTEMQADGLILVKFSLLDTVRHSVLITQSISGKSTDLRMTAHHIADLIFENLTGIHGAFCSQITYVHHRGNVFNLVVADSDGNNEKIVFSANSNIMSPVWSPDGNRLAFVVFQEDHAVVYVKSLASNQLIEVADFPESNSAPAWSPDRRHLAFAITKDGSSHIYNIGIDGSELKQLTFDDAIDTEPSFSPDGKTIIFISDRGGSVQTYQLTLDGGELERLTFEDGQSFSPRFSPDGSSFVFSKWVSGKFHIATADLKTMQMQVLTDGGWERTPSFAPNGKMILYATEENGHGILSTVSIDGRVKQKLTSQTGDILDPDWGPLIKR